MGGNRRWAAYGRYGLVLALSGLAVFNGGLSTGGRYLTWYSAVAVACGAALIPRRLPWPIAPLLTTAAAAWWGWLMLPLLLVALFGLAAHRHATVAVGCGLLALAGDAVTRPVMSLWQPQHYGSSLFLLLAITAGLWMGSRRRLVDALNARVEHLRIERELREQAARAAERSAIAAEMHDVLAHRLSLIALHTGALTGRSASLPSAVSERLVLLRTAATDALADLRDVLGALHASETEAKSTEPVLPEVRDLVAQAREAGQRVALDIHGHPDNTPAAHRLAVYRVVREALTNARKHADGSSVDVRLGYRPAETVVEVVNGPTFHSVHVEPSGFGLVGLRERVTALGGTLRAGPDSADGWRVTAHIPHPPSVEEDTTRS